MADKRKPPGNRKKKHSRSRNMSVVEDTSQTSSPEKKPSPRQKMLSKFVQELNSGEPVSKKMRCWWLSQY